MLCLVVVSPLRQFLAVIYSTTFYIPPSRPLVAGQLLFSIPLRRLAAWMAVYAEQGGQNAMEHTFRYKFNCERSQAVAMLNFLSTLGTLSIRHHILERLIDVITLEERERGEG